MQNNEQLFLQKLSDSELLFDTREAIKAEREATSIVVRYFREISARELHLKHACSSLFQFATEKLGYCGASAQARINAMELVVALPEVEKKIESGELSLTAAAKVQSFFRAEKKAKKIYTEEQKLQVVEVCLSKSTREVERELASRNSDVERVENVKPVGADRFELRFSITSELESKVKKLKCLLAHSQPNISTEELLETLVELGLEKFDPARKAERVLARAVKKHNASKAQCESVTEPISALRAHETKADFNARYIPAKVRHEVWRKNAGKGCEYESEAGARCGSHHALQIDHIEGFALGGESYAQNLRVLCASHNRYVWKCRAGVLRETAVPYEMSA